MERALDLLLSEGAGRDYAILQNNLAVARYPLDGPARSLAQVEEGISFCEKRGLVESAAQLEANCPGLLAELGRTEAALELAGRLRVAFEASGDMYTFTEVRAVELACRVARGEAPVSVEAERLLDAARKIGGMEVLAVALAAGAAVLAAVAPADARAALADLDQHVGRETPYYARHLPGNVRAALVAGDAPLAGRLVEGLKLRYPLEQHALCAVRAQLAEHAHDHAAAASLYAEAAGRWQSFGSVPERAHALLGQGRCLLALGQTSAQEPLREAGDLFAAMGYRPALAETVALIEQTAAAQAS
jgi:hypothetical protein